MHKIIAFSLLVPTLAFAKSVTFPNLPNQVSVKAGSTLKINTPAAKVQTLQPGGASYAGIPLYKVNLQYMIDGGPVQSLSVAAPHSTGQGGYDGTATVKSVSIKVPAGAKQVQYWLQGTNMLNQNPTYYSNYGKNFSIDVQQ